MAGFLNRLAARALGAVPLAEPLVPARFTPSRDPVEWTSSASEHANLFSEAAPKTELEKTEQTRKSGSNLPPQRQQPRTVAQPEIVHFDSPLPSRSQALQSEPLVEASAHAHPLLPTSKPLAPLETAPSASVEDRLPTSQRVTAFTPPPFVEAAHAARMAERQVPDPATAQRNPLHHQPSSSTPVVRVTIGRIDVRAELANPPSAAPVARKQAPTVSLDQFLKQRSAGKR